jgi:phosphonate transport system substrate-binding protein
VARKLLFALVLLLVSITASHAQKDVVRFGLTAVVVRENLRFFDDMTIYLSQKLDRPVIFVRRKSYREIMDLLANGNLDFAWICGYPLVQKRDPEYLAPISIPIYKGKPLYRSYTIVHRDSPYRSIVDLSKKVFAYSDPDSNSGFLYPRHYLSKLGHDPDSFFRQTVFTYNHAETVEAVAARFADGGAVESYIWEYLNETNPALVEQTRVIHASPTFGFPPIGGRRLLNTLHLDGFGTFYRHLYDGIRLMAAEMRNGTSFTTISETAEVSELQ